MKRVIVLAAFLVSSVAAQAVELGGGYNEQLADVYNALIVKSKIKWVRAYVNIPRNYLTYQYPPFTALPNPIGGVMEGNLYQQPDHVSSDADVLAIAAVDRLIYAKTVKVHCDPIKVILSLKHDFTYPYNDKFPFGRVPTTPEEQEYVFEAIKTLLETNDRGQYIDILVVGNEPMFEIQPNTEESTASAYFNYLNFLVPKLDDLKNTKGWNFDLFVGALNRPSNLNTPPNTILPAVLNFLQANPKRIAGIDLHEHVMEPTDVRLDIQLVKQYLQPGQKIIATEFSLIELWNAHQNDLLGAWGILHGYPADWKLYQFINCFIDRAAVGRPMSRKHFMSYFNAQSWYPKHWFRTMYKIFQEEGVYAVTYGLEESPRYPWALNKLNGESTPWVLNAVYNGTLFGIAKDGYYHTNPLVYPDFREEVKKMS